MAKKAANKKEVARFSPKLDMGLGYSQVEQRIREHKTNARILNPAKSSLKIIAENVFSFCNIITLVLIVLLFVIGENSDTFSSMIIFLNITVGIVQGIKARNAVKKLSFEVDSDFEVIRDCKLVAIPVREIVLDDLVIMRAGSKVPVDGIIREGVIDVDESILTGEANLVKKSAGDYLLSGSHILVGEAVVQADRVGMDSNIQKIGKAVRKLGKPKSKIFYSLDYIIKIISFILVPLAIASFFVNYFATEHSLHDAVKFTAASVLSMLPVGMFFLTSCALAASVLKLSQKNTLVQDLYGVEMLALVDTLLLDKTGTITTGDLRLVSRKVFLQEEDTDKILADLLAGTKDINSTARALRKEFPDGDAENVALALPFYSGRKYSGVTLKDGRNYLLGAPEYVSTFEGEVKEYAHACAEKGKRVVLLSRLDGDILFPKTEKCTPILALEIEDEIRADAPSTLRWFKENGVRIMVISGDDPLTVSRIAEKAGVDGSENYISCADLSDEELKEALNTHNIFGRVSPEQKSTIVNYLRKEGHTVGMVGDGVNDVHALKNSDCSISFGSANEVARSVSGIVLVDSKFSSLPQVVAEGRRVVCNIEHVASLYFMKNLFTIIMTAIFLCLGRLYPFSTSQMLMIELFVLGIPNLFIAMQPNDQVPDGNFLQNVLKRTYPATLSLLFSVLAVYFLFCNVFSISAEMRPTVAALTLTGCGFVQLIFNCMPINRYRLKVILFSFIGFIAAVFIFYGLNSVGMNYISFEVGAINAKGFGVICLGIAICAALNVLFHFILKKIRSGGKESIPVYLEDYYIDTTEGEDLSDRE
ncbi:MAG: HAD-IC family P-type ATPase [Clostridia bacterium]|nr:HAD-IC family P-type ATPase [Clostridia bacterium]